MIKGKFLAHDDFDLAGHRLLNWQWLKDLPTDDATEGQVIAYVDGYPTWATLTSGGIVSVAWNDITGKPATYPPDSHTHPWDQVTDKPTFVNSITAGIGIDISSQTGTVQISDQYAPDMNMPTGFVNTTDSTRSHTNNRTYTIEPVGDSYRLYVKGLQFDKTTTDSVTWPDADGLYWFFFNDNGTLTRSTTSSTEEELIMENALVGNIYWDATNNTVIGHSEERHGITMSPATHHYLHESQGAQFIFGHALGDITADGSGDLDLHATMSVAAGEIADEDLFLAYTGTTNTTQVFNVYFKEGTGVWRRRTAVDAPIVYNSTFGRVAYNNYNVTTASWEQADPTNGRFVLTHIFRTNSASNGYIAIQGEEAYNNLNDARLGATTELSDLVVAGLPTKEFVPLGSVIYQTNSGYSNTWAARIRTTDLGNDYVDWREQELKPGTGPQVHANLSGLQNPDHPLTALQQSSATTNQAVVWNGATWTAQPIVNDVTAGTNITVSATNGTAISIATVTSPSFANVDITGKLRNAADQDTYIQFGSNYVGLGANGADRLAVSATAISLDLPVIAYDGIDVDTGDLTVAGIVSAGGTSLFSDISIENVIVHSGDTDTKISFTTNQIDLVADNTTILSLNAGTATVDGDLDVSGTVEANTYTHAGNLVRPSFTAYKSSDETISSDNSYSEDAEIKILTGTSKVYAVEALILYSSNTTADIKMYWDFNFGSGDSGYFCVDFADSTTYTGLVSGLVMAGQGVGTIRVSHMRGVAFSPGVNARFSLYWAQATSNASNTTVHQGSWLQVKEIG